MKILEIHIYGYGQLENVSIRDVADFQVFYGENEAGKSTIMAFIHGILFGFPTKLHTELRYEPRHTSKYGGKLRVYHEKLGYAVIERVKGKAAGDVQVVMDSGRIGGEELLKELLERFDKNLFQAVFSFNLYGLQNIHQMKGEEIGKFLFSAGTLGTEQLSKTETVLQKELDARFKPTGKKPFLNEKFQELQEIHADLKKAAAKNKEYESLIKKKEQLQQEIDTINHELQELGDKVKKLNEWKRIESIVIEEKWIEKEVIELGDIPFPERGIERIEKLNQLIHPYRAEVISLTDRINQVKEEIAEIQPDLTFLENEPAILTLLEQGTIYEQLTLEKQQCDMKLAEYEERLSAISEKLHLPLSGEEIFSINTNIYMKNQVEIASRKRDKLAQMKEELEERYQEENSLLSTIDKEIRLQESYLLPKHERAHLEDQVNNGNDKKNVEVELQAVKDKIEFYQIANERDKAAKLRNKKQKNTQFLLFEMILAILTLYGLVTRQWILLLLGLIGCILVAVVLRKGKEQQEEEDVNHVLSILKEKERQLAEKLQSAEYLDISKLEEQLIRDNKRREELQTLQIKLRQQQSQFAKVMAKLDEWEFEAEQNKEKLVILSKELNIPEYIAIPYLLEAFELIEQFKAVFREKSQYHTRREQIIDQQSKILKEMNSLAERYLYEQGLGIQKTAYLLRNKLREEHEKQIKAQERREKLADMEADLKQKSQSLEHLMNEYNKLLNTAEASSEQHFYLLGKKAERQGKLTEKLESIRSQLDYSILSKQEREDWLTIPNSDEVIQEYNHLDQLLQEKRKEVQEEQASIKYEIGMLEEGGVYSDILHHYKQKKYELDEAAKEWSIYCLAQDILTNTIEKYKNIYLPRMLSKAEEYLSFLTNGSYLKIHLKETGTGFLVERADRTLFEANELSQATTEQLYVSIRLALATTLYENYPFPIIIDDSFVNFDGQRTQRVLELLQRLGNNQVLFFTCHAHLLHLFKKHNVLSLEKGTVQNIS